MKILVLKYRNIGDVILSSALISNLKNCYPNSRIDFATNYECKDVIDENPNIESVITFNRNKIKKLNFFRKFLYELRTIKKIKAERYDLVINLTEGDRGVIYSFFSGANVKLGIVPSNPFFSRIGVFNKEAENNFDIHVVEKDLNFINLLNQEITNKELSIFWSRKEELSLNAKLKEILKTDFIVVHPVSRWMFKCWDDEKMSKAIDYLSIDKGFKVVITGSNSHVEKDKIHAIMSMCKSDPISMHGNLNLKELAFLISKAKFFFGVDSAPMHIASACKTRVIALFGASNPVSWGPWFDGKKGFENTNGIQDNNFHYIVSNMDKEIFYDQGQKKSRGMEKISYSEVRKVFDKLI